MPEQGPSQTVMESRIDEKPILIQIKPIYEPFNSDADGLTIDLLSKLGLTTSGPKYQAYRTMMSSILYAAKAVIRREASQPSHSQPQNMPVYMGMLLGNDHWTQFPALGATIGRRVLKMMEAGKFIERDPHSGRREFYATNSAKTAYEGIMTRWTVAPALTSLLSDSKATFIETARPFIQINKSETRTEKENRRRHGDIKKRLSRSEFKKAFGEAEIRNREERIKRLNDYWYKHPLVSVCGDAAACVTRVFSDSRLDVGGRLYGSWTGTNSELRLKYTIDGEPLLQLDISASQPTLLSILLNIEMRNLSPQKGWYDPYTELTWLIGLAMSGNLSEEERDITIKRVRTIAKGVVMELIGTGNPDKATPSDGLVQKTNVSQDEWDYYKQELKAAIPALNRLEPRFDREGNPTGYINGSGYLAFHESEIILQTLENLAFEYDVPAYPVHDCLLVKVSDWSKAYAVFVETICSYVEKFNGRQVIVPISREGGGLPYKKFRGVYDTCRPQHLSDNKK